MLHKNPKIIVKITNFRHSREGGSLAGFPPSRE